MIKFSGKTQEKQKELESLKKLLENSRYQAELAEKAHERYIDAAAAAIAAGDKKPIRSLEEDGNSQFEASAYRKACELLEKQISVIEKDVFELEKSDALKRRSEIEVSYSDGVKAMIMSFMDAREHQKKLSVLGDEAYSLAKKYSIGGVPLVNRIAGIANLPDNLLSLYQAEPGLFSELGIAINSWK